MLREGFWQMLLKTLIINILFYFLTGNYVKLIIDCWFAPVALLSTFPISLSLIYCSCVPLYNFDYIYSYLMETNISFIDW